MCESSVEPRPVFGEQPVFGCKSASGERCSAHITRLATNLCNYCSRPYCEDCLEKNEGSILSMGNYSYRCRSCREDMRRLKKQQRDRDSAFCLRHPETKTKTTCEICNEAICQFCIYLPVVGLLRKRLGSGRYCFSCARHCLSGKRCRPFVVDHFSDSMSRRYIF
jgi:hypothetical protein